MMIEPIVPAVAGSVAAAAQPTLAETSPVRFADWLNHAIETTNTQLVQADQGVRKLALGETDNLHQVMVDLEKAKLSFELLVQVRNKLLDSYQELMRMQI
jgi:flagellar hook-basal body complex protein FliE